MQLTLRDRRTGDINEAPGLTFQGWVPEFFIWLLADFTDNTTLCSWSGVNKFMYCEPNMSTVQEVTCAA